MGFTLPSFLTTRLGAGLAGDAQLIRHGRLSGPMPWVVAIMVALTVIATAAGLALSNVARSAADDLSGGVTVQVVEANPAERNRQADAAVQSLQSTPGVVDVHRVSQDEVERLIEPWLGAKAGEDQEIPIPALIDVRLRDKVDGEALGALRREIREIAPAARVDAQSTWLKPVFGAIDSLRWLALALVVLLGFALAAAVLLAVRSAMGSNRTTIEIIHLLGGTDRQVARIFQRSVGFDALGGGVIGLAAGVAVVYLFGNRFADLEAGLVQGGALGLFDWLLLGLVPVGGAVLAVVTARQTVLRTLRKMV